MEPPVTSPRPGFQTMRPADGITPDDGAAPHTELAKARIAAEGFIPNLSIFA